MLAFYADESGSFSVSDPGQPWVVLLAIGFDDDHWAAMDHAVTTLKKAYFPHRLPREVEIGSNDLRMAHVRPNQGNPFSSLDAATLRRFGARLYDVLDASPFEWCASVIHKPAAAYALSVSRSDDLFALAYRELLRTLDRWCDFANQPGRLFMDQRSSDLNGAVHGGIVRVHDDYRGETPSPRPHVVERPYFHDSARSNHIQIADIVAYNVLRRFRNDDPEYPYYRRIASKVWRSSRGSKDGLVLYPPSRQK